MDAFDLGLQIKRGYADLPVVLLAHSIKGIYPPPEGRDTSGIDQTFIWSGDSDLLLAIVKSMEDRLNVAADTQKAMVRILISGGRLAPVHILFSAIDLQGGRQPNPGSARREPESGTPSAQDARTRPKILVAGSYEQALSLYRQYGDYLFGIISDTPLSQEWQDHADAGYTFLREVRQAIPDLPLLLIQPSEPGNKGPGRPRAGGLSGQEQ